MRITQSAVTKHLAALASERIQDHRHNPDKLCDNCKLAGLLGKNPTVQAMTAATIELMLISGMVGNREAMEHVLHCAMATCLILGRRLGEDEQLEKMMGEHPDAE